MRKNYKGFIPQKNMYRMHFYFYFVNHQILELHIVDLRMQIKSIQMRLRLILDGIRYLLYLIIQTFLLEISFPPIRISFCL